jgi:uncharacterized protein YjiK
MNGRIHPIRIGLFILLVGGGPTPSNGQISVLDAYDFSKDGGHEIRLPKGLDEVSGLAMTPEGRLFAHNDERAIIYELELESGRILKAFSAGFGGIRGDFEGIALAGQRFFLSTSTGEIVETEEGSPGSAMGYQVHLTDLGESCELEGMAFDPEANTLLLPCKEVRARDMRDHIVVFSVEVGTMTVARVPRIFLPLDELEAMGLKGSFSPSGIEVDPESGNLFLISARGEAILEFSSQGRLLGVRNLKKKNHAQPEGITFDPRGALLLADEGQGKRGRLTRYPRRDQGEEVLR